MQKLKKSKLHKGLKAIKKEERVHDNKNKNLLLKENYNYKQ